MTAKVDKEKCTGCSDCMDVCPVEAITMVDNKAKVDEGNCVDCGACVSTCSVEAIDLE